MSTKSLGFFAARAGMSFASARGVRLSWAFLLLTGCYLSHETGAADAAVRGDAGPASRDAGRDAPAVRDEGVDAPDVDAGPPCAETLRTYLAEYARAVCAGLSRCPGAGPGEDAVVASWLAHPDDCARVIAERYLLGYGSVSGLLDAPGHIDCAAVPGCLAHLSATCPGTVSSLEFPSALSSSACDGVYVQRPQPVGTPCVSQDDCALGEYCVEQYVYVDTRWDCAACEPQFGDGQPCNDIFDCLGASTDPSIMCVRASPYAPGTCGRAVINLAAGEGEPCGIVALTTGPSGPFGTYTPCMDGLSCELAATTDGAGHCVRPGGVGAGCTAAVGRWCASGLACDGSVCTPLHLAGEGEPCGTSSASVCDAAARLACVDGICRPTGTTLGAPCNTDPSYGPLECDGVLRCLSDGHCAPSLPDGAPCTEDWECTSFACSTTCLSSMCPPPPTGGRARVTGPAPRSRRDPLPMLAAPFAPPVER